MTYCKMVPEPKGRKGKQSSLFADLTKNISDRETVKSIYSLVTSDTFRRKFGGNLIFDENNEPTFESVQKYINMDVLAENGKSAGFFENMLNAVEETQITRIADKAVNFNKTHSNYVALPEKTASGKTRIRVYVADNEKIAQAEKLSRAHYAYTKLDKFLAGKGVSVKWLDANLLHGEDAIIMPENYKSDIEGIYGVINLANNMEGYYAMSEEAAHFIIENIKDNEIVRRAEAFLNDNPEIMQAVAGDEYNDIVRYYSEQGKEHLITREILGRIMADSINRNLEPQISIFARLKKLILDFIRRHFRISNNDIQSFDDIRNAFNNIASDVFDDMVLDESTLDFFKKFGDRLAHATKNASTIDRMIGKAQNDMLANMLKYLHVYKPDVENAIESAAQIKKQFDKYTTSIKENNMLEVMNDFAASAVDILNKNINELRKVRGIFLSSKNANATYDPTSWKISKNASTMTQIKNLIDTYREPIMEYILICEEMASPRYHFNGETVRIATELKKQLSIVQSLINQTENLHIQVTKEFLNWVLTPYFDSEGITYIGADKKKHIITLMDVLECSMGDISGLNRMMLAAANTDDLWVGLVSHYIQTHQEIVRQNTLEYNHKIDAIDRKYRKASGKRDTSFIYARDRNGIPIGMYISEYDYPRYYEEKDKEERRLKALGMTKEEIEKSLKEWEIKHTKPFPLTSKETWTDSKGQVHHWTREYRVPIYKSDALDKLTPAQREYYDSMIAVKRELDWFIPSAATHPFKTVQMRMEDIAEAIATSKQGIIGNFTNALSAVRDKYFSVTELDGEEYDGGKNLTEKIAEKLKIKHSTDVSSVTRFDNTPYETVPLYFTQELDDMRHLSTDGTGAMQEYAVMAVHYGHMHKLVDVMELIREQNLNRDINIGGYGENNSEIFDTNNGTVSRPAKKPTAESNVYKRVEDEISTKFYSHAKAQGTYITDKITTAKLADALMRYTSFSMLGYNAYSAINNILVGKYQMLIEAVGGEHFNLKDWGKAEKEYWKMVPKLIKDIGKPRSLSKMALLMEMFNVGQHWKENIRDSKYYKTAVTRTVGKLDPNFMLDLGEHNIQMITCIAYLSHIKLYKEKPRYDENGEPINKEYNKSISLFDALTVKNILDDNGNVIDARLVIDDKYKDWVQEDDKKFDLTSSKNITYHTLLIGKLNQDMHGIYNREDAMIIKKYAVGRFGTMYRNHIIPQLQKRFKSLGKGRGIYNFKSREIEEGYYVTAMRLALTLILPSKSSWLDETQQDLTFWKRWELLSQIMTKHQKANMRKFETEMLLLLALTILSAIAKAGLDDDDEEPTWTQRQLFVQLKRLQMEGTAYFPPTMLNSMMQMLISPTAVISPLQRFMTLLQNVPNHHKLLKTGPYKGHSKLYAAFMRTLPVYPQVKSFISLAKNDSRISIFDSSILETTIINMLENEE